MRHWRWVVAMPILWGLAAAQHFLVAPWLLRLPADYAEETSYEAVSRFRPTLSAPWQEAQVNARRVDQTLVSSHRHNIIQGSLHWTTADGGSLFETGSIYGVDRYTRLNLSGYGDVDRRGQFFFPMHTKARNYHWWDPQFLQGREAVYEGEGVLDGLAVRVFRFEVKGIDESGGYGHLADVPERYNAFTDGKGRLWVEPVSGTIVQYEEEGLSYFTEKTTHRRIGDFYVWSDHFTAKSQAEKFKDARARRNRIHWFERYVPFGLVAAGGLALAIGARRPRPSVAAGATGERPATEGRVS